MNKRELITTKNAPKRPQTAPTINAHGIESNLGDSTATPPNLSSAGATFMVGFPCKHYWKIAEKKTAIEQAKKDFQRTENFQKSLGFESS